MNSARYPQMEEIFHAALERTSAERRAFVESACGSDAALLGEVNAMLDADAASSSLLDRGLPDVAFDIIGAPVDLDGSREIGPYVRKQFLGEGGMGVVWLAERKDAGNQVTIKVLPHAGLSPTRRERFIQEIRTLAKLKHPYIARFYDSGSLPDGTPWFVMEYVNGVPLAEYCRNSRRSIEDDLRIFRKVCEAVRYAHGRAIIHCDLNLPTYWWKRMARRGCWILVLPENSRPGRNPANREQPCDSDHWITRRWSGCAMERWASVPMFTRWA